MSLDIVQIKRRKTEEKAADAKASNNDWDVPEFKGVTAKKHKIHNGRK